MNTMNAFVLHGAKDMRLETGRTRPRIGDKDVLIRITRVGICGSDIHYYQEGYIGRFIPKAPFALGHEFSGTIDAAGAAVTSCKTGDRVTVEPSISCGECFYCRSGRYNLCLNMKFYGSASCFPHIDGGFAEYVLAPERNVIVIPDSMGFDEAAFVEPLSVGMHAVLRAQSALGPRGFAGRTGLVTGGGTIGQTVLLAARAMGIQRIAVSDVAEFPRSVAGKMGADRSFNPAAESFVQEVADFVPQGFDVVFEASGSPRALSQALELAGRGATVVQIGTQPAEASLPVNLVMSKELNVVGSFRYAHVFPLVTDLIATKRVDVRPLITQTYRFEKMQEAMDKAISKEDVIKVQVEFS
ncbi:MAG TPA: L-idonate 5-dehydrogenase [Spirochaetia bacterium]|nr:L-idonate 5-dehydrogenase [Spirochaetia bacterium]